MGTLIHAIPSFIGSYEYGAGNWKSTAANRLALPEVGIPYDEATFDVDDPASLISQIGPEVGDVFLEYSKFPEVVKQLHAARPGLRVHVRPHNAEAYQYFHRLEHTGLRDYAHVRIWRRFLALARQDARCKAAADTLLGNSEWDDGHYWRWLPGRTPMRYLPYYSPWPYLHEDVTPKPWGIRDRLVVSMGGNFDPSGIANYENFDTIATKLAGMRCEQWAFALTWWSRWHDAVPRMSEQVTILRDCAEPWELLCRSRAVAVLTPFGFGLKTTVVDGLAAGCHVVIHPRLAPRIPRDVRRHCIVCDPRRDDDIRALADKLSRPPANHELNEGLRQEAIGALRSILAPAVA